jgi:tripartite-type tricarboxylate transporter receptor subunit TctC
MKLPPLNARLSRRTLLAATGAGLATPWLAAHAQTGKIAGGRPITLVVSYPPGGGADLMARVIAPKLAAAFGQPVVVENKAGASGQLAANHVARATPDGTTLLLDASSFAVNPSLYARLPYDTATAFTPLAVMATFPNVLVCTPSFEAQNVQDVIRIAKARPLNYASSGNGSAQHLAGALFEQRAGVELTHVAYRGGGPAMNDVIGGQVPLFFANVASSLGHIQAGKLRPLAVTSTLRARSLPDVPTMAQAGVSGYEVLEWNPILAPANLPADLKATLVAGIRAALDDAEVLGRIRQLGGEVFADTTQQSAGRFIAAQQAQWAQVIRERGITIG